MGDDGGAGGTAGASTLGASRLVQIHDEHLIAVESHPPLCHSGDGDGDATNLPLCLVLA